MKLIQSAYYALIMFMLLGNTGISSPLRIIDTKKLLEKTMLASNDPVNIKPSNVVYPAILQDHRNASLDYVQKFSDKRRDYLIRTYTRGKKYFSKVTTILKKYNVPQEMKVLIALESGFNANALSSAGARGYWQFMDEVAVEYGLKISREPEVKSNAKVNKGTENNKKTVQKDDRTNFAKSTNAAARYLRDRCRNFNNDVLLVVASYNCGIGNVWSAMKKSGKPNPDFWDIKKFLPSETRNYVMNFIAMNVVFNNYDKFLQKNMVFNDVIITPAPETKDIEAINAVIASN